MAHRIEFRGSIFTLLSQEEIRELVVLFYSKEDASFVIEFVTDLGTTRGRHLYERGTHRILLCEKAIRRSISLKERIGGSSPIRDERLAAASVLVHELCHAIQCASHSDSEIFWTQSGYNRRACERDARRYVDEHHREIAAYLNVEPGHFVSGSHLLAEEMDLDEELDEISSVFEEIGRATVGELLTELKASGISNPTNVMRLRRLLQRRGMRVTNVR